MYAFSPSNVCAPAHQKGLRGGGLRYASFVGLKPSSLAPLGPPPSAKNAVCGGGERIPLAAFVPCEK
jgi:hypothetical protein